VFQPPVHDACGIGFINNIILTPAGINAKRQIAWEKLPKTFKKRILEASVDFTG
jgi:hypothetical protein